MSRFSDTTREKMSSTKIKLWADPIFREKMKERNKKISSALLLNPNRYWLGKKRPEASIWHKGKVVSEETKRKIGIKNTGRKQSIEAKKKNSEWHIDNPNRKFKETSIERIMEKELQKRGIEYLKQVPLCRVAIVDFYLPDYKVAIQCDGCYWHGCPIHEPSAYVERRNRDIGIDIIIESNGFRVFRFWEHEINDSIENCVNKIFYE